VHFAVLFAAFCGSGDVFSRFARALVNRSRVAERRHIDMLKVHVPSLGRSLLLTGQCLASFAATQRAEAHERRATVGRAMRLKQPASNLKQVDSKQDNKQDNKQDDKQDLGGHKYHNDATEDEVDDGMEYIGTDNYSTNSQLHGTENFFTATMSATTTSQAQSPVQSRVESRVESQVESQVQSQPQPWCNFMQDEESEGSDLDI
jgi:hypothetical protein